MKSAKTLFYRRRFFEANEILRIILITDPFNLTARTLRISIFWNLGLDDLLPYSVSEIHFRRADEEAAFTKEICIKMEEDYYCEYGLGKPAQAIRILRLIKKNGGEYEEHDIKLTKEDVYRLVSDSENIFERGLAVSPTGNRSGFLLMCARNLRRLLKADEDIFRYPYKKIQDKHGICNKIFEDIVSSLGWLRKDYPEDMQYYILERLLTNAIRVYNNSVLLKANRINLNFISAAIFWDFYPTITVGMAKNVINWLRDESEMAKRLKEDNLCIYAVTRCHGDILPPDTFVKHVERAIIGVENRVGKLEDLEGKEESNFIEPDRIGGLKLFCLHI